MTLSAATPTKGLSPQVAKESLAYLRRAVERMKSLQATEKVIASVERVMLNRVPEKFDLKPLVTAINALNLILRGGKEDKISASRAAVSRELETVFQALSKRDEFILPSHLRQFCERDGTLLDLNALAALTSFYRALPHTEASRGKYDFVVTRLFSSPAPGRAGRQLRISREQIAKRLTEMCAAWGETIQRNPADATQIAALIQQFDHFIVEVKRINKFEDLIGRSFFPDVRDFKVSVGNLLYLPEMTAASVASNVVIANRFLSLLENEGEEIREAPEAIHKLVDAFSDIYSNEPDEISRILDELQTSSRHDEQAQERVSRFTRMLQLATGVEEELSFPLPPPPNVFLPETESSAELPLEPAVTSVPAATEMPAEWQAFAAQPENQELLAAYDKASTETRKLDLHCFLSPLPEGSHEELKKEDRSRRTSLELIFQVDQIIQTEIWSGREPSGDMEARVDKLFDALGQCSDEMRDLTKVAHQHHQNANYEVLLHVNNQLMAARLRLQSAIVRRSANEIIPYDSQKEQTTTPLPAVPAPKIVRETTTREGEKGNKVQKPVTQNPRRKWLVIVAVLLAIGAVGIRFALTKDKVEVKDDTDVVRLAQNQVPHGELFTQIKLHRDLLLCLVTDKWLTLSAKEQKEKLQELMNYGQERGATRILLLDPKGVTVGSATKDELYVN